MRFLVPTRARIGAPWYSTNMDRFEFLVVGGDAAGMSAASQIRRMKPDASLLVLERGPFVSYAACGIPYLIGGEVRSLDALQVFTPERFKSERNIDVRTHTEAISVDAKQKRVTIRDADGSESQIGYQKLLLATGAMPIVPPWPGMELEGVLPLRHLVHAQQAMEMLPRTKRAVVVGAGYVGLEVAENLRARGLEVTILEKLDAVMGGLHAEMSKMVIARLEKAGITVRTGVTVEGFEGANGALRKVRTDAGDFEAELAIVSLGVRPNVALAQAAGLTLGAGGSIHIDDHMRTSDPSIYAAGDCAEVMHRVSGKPAYIPLALGANRGGRVAGENMAGGDALFPGIVGSAVTRVHDLVIARTGLLASELDRLGMKYTTASTKAPSKAHYFPGHEEVRIELTYDPSDGRLLGALLWGADPSLGKRADVFATALAARMSVEDIADLDLSYAPPFAPVWDPVIQAANKAVWARSSGK